MYHKIQGGMGQDDDFQKVNINANSKLLCDIRFIFNSLDTEWSNGYIIPLTLTCISLFQKISRKKNCEFYHVQRCSDFGTNFSLS